MNSSLKGLTHTILSIVSLWLPTIISSNPTFNLTVGAILTYAVNWLLSHFVATTTGASAAQNPTA